MTKIGYLHFTRTPIECFEGYVEEFERDIADCQKRLEEARNAVPRIEADLATLLEGLKLYQEALNRLRSM